MAKTKNRDIIIALAVVLVGAYMFGAFAQWGYPSPIAGYFNGTVPTTPGQQVNPSDLQAVTKPLKIVGVDELAGSSLDGTTNAIKVYDSDGKTLLETGSLSSGSVTTAQSYSTGKVLWIEYYYDTTIDSYRFWKITVPQMSKADAESLTTNQITMRTREAGAYSDSLISSSGYSFTDAMSYGLNLTGTGNDSMTFTYSFYTTTDNTGYPSFYDPIYELDMAPIVWASLSGGQYSQMSLTGFDGAFEKGTTMYYYKVVSQDAVSKQKVGNDYILPGSGSITFGLNAAGFANTSTTNTTLQVDLKIYSNAGYMQQYGDYGPYDFAGDDITTYCYTN